MAAYEEMRAKRGADSVFQAFLKELHESDWLAGAESIISQVESILRKKRK
jgi:hypothetical protein